jgi:hypothetical protein
VDALESSVALQKLGLGHVADAIEGFEIDIDAQDVRIRNDVERDARGSECRWQIGSEAGEFGALGGHCGRKRKGKHLWTNDLIPLVDVETRNGWLDARALYIANYKKVSEWRKVLGGRFLRFSGRWTSPRCPCGLGTTLGGRLGTMLGGRLGRTLGNGLGRTLEGEAAMSD